MCQRTTADPLLAVVARDDFTLLRTMRTGVTPLNAWVDFTGEGPWEPVGQLGELLEGGLPEIPADYADRPDIENERSGAFEAQVGIGFLAPFFAVIGLTALTKLRARVGAERQAHVRVRASQVREQAISLAALAQELGASQIGANQGRLLTDGRRVAVAARVLQAGEISIQVLSRRGRDVNLGAEFIFAADVQTGAKVHRVSKSEISFTGTQPVTFAARLYELQVDSERRALRLERAPGFDVLGPADQASQAAGRDSAAPLLLDGPDGDLTADL